MPSLATIPVIVLLAGALALSLLNRATDHQNRASLALLTIGFACLGLILLSRALPTGATISRWHPLFGTDLAYHADGLGFLFAALMALVGLAVLTPGLGHSECAKGLSYPALLTLLAAGISFAFSANLITLCLSWVIFDLAFLWNFIGLRMVRKVPHILNLSWLACLSLLGGALLRGDNSLSFLSASALGLVLLAALVRVGLYPLHLWMPIGVEASLPARSLLHFVPASAGLYLLTRLSAWAGAGVHYYGQALSIAGGLAFLVGALLAWIETDLNDRLSFVMIGQVGCITTSLAVVEPRTTIILSSLNLILCLSLLFLSQDEAQPGGIWARAALALAVASLTGVPLTLGFVARWHFYHSILTDSHWALLALALLAETLLFAALLRMWSAISASASPLEGVHERLSLVGAALLAVPILVLGLHPPLLSSFMDWISLSPLLGLLRSTTVAQWATLFLPLLGGYLLQRHRQRVFDPLESFWLKLTIVLRLEWLYGLLGRIAAGAAGALRMAGNIIEGGGYLGWIGILGLLVYLLLRGR